MQFASAQNSIKQPAVGRGSVAGAAVDRFARQPRATHAASTKTEQARAVAGSASGAGAHLLPRHFACNHFSCTMDGKRLSANGCKRREIETETATHKASAAGAGSAQSRGQQDSESDSDSGPGPQQRSKANRNHQRKVMKSSRKRKINAKINM